MYPVTFTITVLVATQAFVYFRPGSIPERQKPIFPDFIEIIPVNIALDEIPVDIRTGRDAAIS